MKRILRKDYTYLRDHEDNAASSVIFIVALKAALWVVPYVLIDGLIN